MIHISIITINFNNSSLTIDFIKSVIKFTPSSIIYEIIVVDNNSKIEDFENLKSILTDFDVNIIRSNINTGFGGGNMLGVEYATGKYLAFINNDVIFIENSFKPLLTFMENNPTVGVIAPQQLDKNKNPAYSFDYFHGIRRILFGSWAVDIFKPIKRKRKIYLEPFSVDMVQGCFMLFDNSIFNKVKGFDTNIFLYYEEMDICWRLKKLGYSSFFVPLTKFIHLEGESTQKRYAIKKELNISRLFVLKKNHSNFTYQFIRVYFLIKWSFKSLFKKKYTGLVKIIWTEKYLENSLRQIQKRKQ